MPVLPCTRVLPVELRADLADTRIARATHQAETAAADVAARIAELSMVENVEELSAHLESHRFCDPGSLRHPEVGINDSRAMEETSAGVAKGAEHCVLLESVRQEVPVPTVSIQFSRVHDHDRPYPVRLVGIAARKRDIAIALPNLYRESRGETGDTVECPPLR